jgi:hypothetical protein
MTPNGVDLGIPRTMDEATSNLPAPDEVRAQLERMMASDDFNRSPQLGAFLRFVVEAVLQGPFDPAWRDDTRGTLAKFFYAPAIVDRLGSDLAAAGLSGRS